GCACATSSPAGSRPTSAWCTNVPTAVRPICATAPAIARGTPAGSSACAPGSSRRAGQPARIPIETQTRTPVMKPLPALLSAVALAAALPACAGNNPAPASAAQVDVHVAASPVAETLPRLLVHKSPSCGCCVHWVEHMREAGFPVEVRDVDDVHAVKERVGVPTGKASCHTAEIAGYFIEGHVPATDVKRLLAESPEARGLTVPGMPAGSPGMEMPDGRVQPYAVELVATDGSITEFA